MSCLKIVLHILVAGGGRKVTDQKPTVVHCLSWVKGLVMSFQLCKDLSCHFILFLSLHSISSFKSLTHTSFPLCRKRMQQVFSPFKRETKAASVSETFSLFLTPNRQRGEHWADSGEEQFCTAVFHRLQTWACWKLHCSTPENKVRNQSSFDSPGGWRLHHLSRHFAPGLSHMHCGNHWPWLAFAPVAPPFTLNSEKFLALSSLDLPRQQLPMNQPFAMLHFPGCTTLDLTDPPLSPCVPTPSPHPSHCKVQPLGSWRRKGSFPPPCWCPGTQPGTWLPTEHPWLMFTHAKPRGSPHSTFQPVPFCTDFQTSHLLRKFSTH